ncbi:MAG TPA: winged helix-turn-helix domain-containing protein [Allocoleopsis sp.]
MRALLRRPPTLESGSGSTSSAVSSFAVSSQPLQVDDLQLDLDNQIAYRGERAIDLSEKECQLLAYFMGRPNQLLSHQQIYADLWGSDKPSSNVLAAQVRLLRRKIEAPGESQLIHSVYGKGYRFGNTE